MLYAFDVVYVGEVRILPHDAMRERGTRCRPVSVHLSVTLVYCIQTAEDVLKILSRPSSSIILFFLALKLRYLIQRGTHSSGALNKRGLGKFAIFD